MGRVARRAIGRRKGAACDREAMETLHIRPHHIIGDTVLRGDALGAMALPARFRDMRRRNLGRHAFGRRYRVLPMAVIANGRFPFSVGDSLAMDTAFKNIKDVRMTAPAGRRNILPEKA